MLVTGLVPDRATVRLADMLDLVRNDAGFLAAEHPILRPAQSSLEGVYLAGCAPGPRPSRERRAGAVGGGSPATVQPGRILARGGSPLTRRIPLRRVHGLRRRLPLPGMHARRGHTSRGRGHILCRGCGTCVAACPSGAARARHFTDEQLHAEIAEGRAMTETRLLIFVCNWCSYGGADTRGA